MARWVSSILLCAAILLFQTSVAAPAQNDPVALPEATEEKGQKGPYKISRELMADGQKLALPEGKIIKSGHEVKSSEEDNANYGGNSAETATSHIVKRGFHAWAGKRGPGAAQWSEDEGRIDPYLRDELLKLLSNRMHPISREEVGPKRAIFRPWSKRSLQEPRHIRMASTQSSASSKQSLVPGNAWNSDPGMEFLDNRVNGVGGQQGHEPNTTNDGGRKLFKYPAIGVSIGLFMTDVLSANGASSPFTGGQPMNANQAIDKSSLDKYLQLFNTALGGFKTHDENTERRSKRSLQNPGFYGENQGAYGSQDDVGDQFSKRDFSSWAGKRAHNGRIFGPGFGSSQSSSLYDPYFHFLSQYKQNYNPEVQQLFARMSADGGHLAQGDGQYGSKRDSFSAWAGKRSMPYPNGDKRNSFSAWAGKRNEGDDFINEGKRGFSSWAGKRANFHETDQIGENEEKRGDFSAWAGKRAEINPGAPEPRTFGVWAGKRPDIESRFPERPQPRAFSAWAGKRGGGDTYEIPKDSSSHRLDKRDDSGSWSVKSNSGTTDNLPANKQASH